jgi:hypothetical protein
MYGWLLVPAFIPDTDLDEGRLIRLPLYIVALSRGAKLLSTDTYAATFFIF